MLYKMNQRDREIMNKVYSITKTDYEIVDDSIPVDSLIYAIDELLDEIEHLETKIKDIEQDIESNYRELTPSELYGDLY